MTPRRRETLLPTILIAVGVLWFLIAIGFVPPRIVDALWVYWPLLVIGIGLDMLLPRARPAGVPYAVIAAAIVVLAGLIGTPWTRQANASERLNAPIDGARSATVRLELASARARVAGGAAPGMLAVAQVDGALPAVLRSQGTQDRLVTLAPRPGPPRLRFGGGTWDVALTDALPLTLEVDGGSGPASLDLSAIQLTRLTADGGSGSLEIALPASDRTYPVRLDGASGGATLHIPGGASVDLQADTGSGPTRVEIASGSDVRIRLGTGSGGVIVDVPDRAPVRLDVRDDGSGPLRVASFLERRSGSGDTGVWQSASYAAGGRTVEIRVDDAGSGPIEVR